MPSSEYERAGAEHRVEERERLTPCRVREWAETEEQHGEGDEAARRDEPSRRERSRQRRRGRRAAQAEEAHEPAESDRGSLTAEAVPGEGDRGRGDGERHPAQVGREGPAHRDDREPDDRHGHQLEPVHPARAADVGGPDRQRDGRHRHCGRQREARPRREPARDTGPARADRHAELARRRAGQQIRDCDELGELLLVDPAPLLDVDPAKEADVGDRPAEGRQAETECDREDLGGAAGVRQSRVAPGFHSGSPAPASALAARARMKRRSESLFR